MNIEGIFGFLQRVWLSLVGVTTPFFEWLTTELEIIDMTPFEFIFGVGIMVILIKAIMKFMSGLS